MLQNSTVSGNSARAGGGGVYSASGNVTLTNSTVTGNPASMYGNGIFALHSITAWNSVISGNVGSTTEIYGVMPSGGSNLIGNVANLNLGPLADNGGPSRTMLPQADSAAIDDGDMRHIAQLSTSVGLPARKTASAILARWSWRK